MQASGSGGRCCWGSVSPAPWTRARGASLTLSGRPAEAARSTDQELETRSVEITVPAPTSSDGWDMSGSRSRLTSGPTTDNAAAL
jgi:hypothetical protein